MCDFYLGFAGSMSWNGNLNLLSKLFWSLDYVPWHSGTLSLKPNIPAFTGWNDCRDLNMVYKDGACILLLLLFFFTCFLSLFWLCSVHEYSNHTTQIPNALRNRSFGRLHFFVAEYKLENMRERKGFSICIYAYLLNFILHLLFAGFFFLFFVFIQFENSMGKLWNIGDEMRLMLDYGGTRTQLYSPF